MAGYVELSIVLAQVSTRMRLGDDSALAVAHEVLSEAAMRLRDGKPPLPTRWPEPPPGFSALPIDPRYHAEYVAGMHARFADLDAALTLVDRPASALDTAYRAVHGLKSAAAGVSDDAMAWFCHGLEGRLKEAPRTGRAARDFLEELARHRAVLGLLLEDPPRGLETLRAWAERRLNTQRPGAETFSPARSQSNLPAAGELRVPVAAVDRALERLTELEAVHDELRALVDLAYSGASRLRLLRSQLLDLPRRVTGENGDADFVARVEEIARGLGSLATTTERGGFVVRRAAAEVRAGARDLQGELTGLRMTTAGALFERATRGLAEQAAPFGKSVDLVTSGDETPLQRPLADKVFEALSQIVRNAVAHGIEPETERVAAGKPASGRLELSARRLAGRLRIEVSDDGRGVDIEALRRTAGSLGMAPVQRLAPDDELLALLALQGLTTKGEANLLAGRGVGLDLAHQTVLALGGSLTLRSRPEQGFVAALEFPLAGSATDLLWLRAGGTTFALPTQYARRVASSHEPPPDILLSELLGLPQRRPVLASVELSVHGFTKVVLGVDSVGSIESRVVHPVAALVQSAGPYAGAIRRGDGSLRLVLDVPAVAARARTALEAREA
jgi:two-component system chemotaxis sensor kinase CheA